MATAQRGSAVADAGMSSKHLLTDDDHDDDLCHADQTLSVVGMQWAWA